MKLLKTYVILIVIVAIFAGAMFALNLHTGPIIEKNNAGAANDKLNAVMPGGSESRSRLTQLAKALGSSSVTVSGTARLISRLQPLNA